jgi:nicotinamidase/pyrazinamidase
MKRFVVIVDTQSDFMHASGALAVAGAEALIPAAEAFLRALRPEETEGILFTYDTHEPDIYAASPEGEEFPLHCVRGSAGWENVLDPALIDPAIPVWRLEKGVFDMWAEADVEIGRGRGEPAPPVPRDAFFEGLLQCGVTQVTVIGVAADYCVKWAVEGLIERGFAVSVPRALTRGIARDIDLVAAEDFGGRLSVAA